MKGIGIMKSFNYQLTEWANDQMDLGFALEQFHKYKAPYVIRKNFKNQFAIYTEGKELADLENFEIRKRKDPIHEVFDSGYIN